MSEFYALLQRLHEEGINFCFQCRVENSFYNFTYSSGGKTLGHVTGDNIETIGQYIENEILNDEGDEDLL